MPQIGISCIYSAPTRFFLENAAPDTSAKSGGGPGQMRQGQCAQCQCRTNRTLAKCRSRQRALPNTRTPQSVLEFSCLTSNEQAGCRQGRTGSRVGELSDFKRTKHERWYLPWVYHHMSPNIYHHIQIIHQNSARKLALEGCFRDAANVTHAISKGGRIEMRRLKGELPRVSRPTFRQMRRWFYRKLHKLTSWYTMHAHI
jgi:hypothetical protein